MTLSEYIQFHQWVVWFRPTTTYRVNPTTGNWAHG